MSRIVFENSLEGICVTDAKSRVMMVNPAFTTTTGYRAEDVVGKNPAILKSGRQDETFYREFWRALSEEGRWTGEIWNRRKDGTVYPEWMNICSVKDRNGRVENYVAIFSDITERKKREELITYQAFHDSLTGLPNRVLFLDRLEQMLVKAKRTPSGMAAVMFLDLDKFKEINDTLGHEAGDDCLKGVAERLRLCVRASDTVARMGGDEFTMLLPEVGDVSDVATVAKKILDAMKEPLILAGRPVVITTSIGISLYPQNGEDSDTLLSHADAAMYTVKGSGRAGLAFYAANLQSDAVKR
jgi:diguanylate cyclase (GGDEF)-like protein/PAS domain S-box-containing protein